MKKTLTFLLISAFAIPFAGALSTKFDAQSRFRIASEAPTSRASRLVKAFIKITENFDTSQLEANIIRRLGNILLVSADMESLVAAAELDGVERISIEKKLSSANHISAEAVGARKVAAGSTERPPFTGKGVVAGLFDTGFDVQNPSFSDADGNNRIECLFHYPEAECEPVVYDSASLQELDTEDRDNCHGTHVLGTMAGKYTGKGIMASGTDSRETVDGAYFAGMATDAAIAVAAGNLSDANIIDGIGRIADHASESGRPCVINLSISELTGPHDGSDLFATSLSEIGKEAVLVMSAGNYSSHKRTISKTFSSADTRVGTFLWPVWWNLNHAGALAVWSGDKEPLNFRLQIGRNDKTILYDLPLPADTEEYIIVTDDYTGGAGRPDGGVTNTDFNTGYTDSYIAVLTDRSPSGRHCYYIAYELHRRQGGNIMPGVMVSGKPGQRVDMYLESDWGELLGFYMDGYRDGGDDMTISSMAAAEGTISVGAWTSLPEWPTIDSGMMVMGDGGYTTGSIAYFSSFGTLIDGRQLPTVSAPGAAVISTYSTPYYDAHAEEHPYGVCAKSTDTAEPVYWTAMYGTSMSSPVVAGAIAQWLEADPSLTTLDVIDVIRNTATVDEAVLECPERWGAGKFDALAGLSAVLERNASITSPVIGENAMTVLRKGSALEIFICGTPHFEASLHNLAGTCVARIKTNTGKAAIETDGLPRGIYIVNAGSNRQKIVL